MSGFTYFLSGGSIVLEVCHKGSFYLKKNNSLKSCFGDMFSLECFVWCLGNLMQRNDLIFFECLCFGGKTGSFLRQVVFLVQVVKLGQYQHVLHGKF